MDAIHLTAKVGNDHRIVIDLPPDVEIGTELDLVIRKHETKPVLSEPMLTREEARAKLLAAGRLSVYAAPEGVVPLTPEQRLSLSQRRPGSPSLDDMINEDRGPY